MNMHLFSSIGKENAFFEQLWRDSSGNDVVTM